MLSHNSTVLVTGGAGFIGSHVVTALLERGLKVLNLDLLTYAGNLDHVGAAADGGSYSFVQGDIGDRTLVGRLMEEFRPNVLLNLAAETHVDRSIEDSNPFIYSNVVALNNLLQTCLYFWKQNRSERFRFVQMSTDEVFGSIAVGEFREEDAFAPNSPYAATKAASDHLVRAYQNTYGLPTMTVRSSNAYGPRQLSEKFIPHMISSAVRGLKLPVYGDGNNVRDWLYVKDLAFGIISAIENGVVGEAYNFSAQNERPNIDVVRTICLHLDRLRPESLPNADRIDFVEDRPGHDKRYAVSSSKARRLLNWAPAVTFEQGIETTVQWFLENPEWQKGAQTDGYALRRRGLLK